LFFTDVRLARMKKRARSPSPSSSSNSSSTSTSSTSTSSTTSSSTAITSRIRAAWQKIEKALASKPNALASLNPPVTEEELITVEKAIGQTLPADVREVFLVHNGQDMAKIQDPVDTLLNNYEPCVVLLPVAQWSTHLDPGNLEPYAEGIGVVDEEEDPQAKKQKSEEEEKPKGKGGKGLISKIENPFSGFVAFATSEVVGREEESAGFFLGFHKEKDSPPQVYPFSFQGMSLDSLEPGGTFVDWFEDAAAYIAGEKGGEGGGEGDVPPGGDEGDVPPGGDEGAAEVPGEKQDEENGS